MTKYEIFEMIVHDLDYLYMCTEDEEMEVEIDEIRAKYEKMKMEVMFDE